MKADPLFEKIKFHKSYEQADTNCNLFLPSPAFPEPFAKLEKCRKNKGGPSISGPK